MAMLLRERFKLAFIVYSLLLMGMLSACQEEIIEINEPQAEEAFTKTSLVAAFMLRTSLQDGSEDNIIDHASCIKVILPISVIANGIELNIDSVDQFDDIEKILDESDVDIDVLEIIFPITVILSDHTEVLVDDKDELENLANECVEGGVDDDIECLDFKYPLEFSIFNTQNQIADVLTVENDAELHEFLEDLDENAFVSLSFPITVIVFSGEEMTINNNIELEAIIESVKDDCDEDDDNDFDEDDIDDSELIGVLLTSNWEVTYFFDNVDESSNYEPFIFAFFEDGTAQVMDEQGMNLAGDWTSYGDKGVLELRIDFGSDKPLDKLKQEWEIIEFDSVKIRLQKESGGEGSSEFLNLEKTNRTAEQGPTFAEVIVDGDWFVAEYIEADTTFTADYEGYSLNFSSDGTSVASDGVEIIDGTWAEISQIGFDLLELNFGSTKPFDEFNDDWDIIDVTTTMVTLRTGNGGSVSTLTLSKL